MHKKYGYTIKEWNAAKKEMHAILVEIAKMKNTIPYSELVQKIKTIVLEPESYALANMLGEISKEEDLKNQGMLSVIVVHKDGDMQPGEGFFKYAEELGRDTSDKLKCWIEELNRVHGFWSNNKSK
jgi:hypothetical protein